jgi:hypothetical protein
MARHPHGIQESCLPLRDGHLHGGCATSRQAWHWRKTTGMRRRNWDCTLILSGCNGMTSVVDLLGMPYPIKAFAVPVSASSAMPT